jgi:hypothetical protein
MSHLENLRISWSFKRSDIFIKFCLLPLKSEDLYQLTQENESHRDNKTLSSIFANRNKLCSSQLYYKLELQLEKGQVRIFYHQSFSCLPASLEQPVKVTTTGQSKMTRVAAFD